MITTIISPWSLELQVFNYTYAIYGIIIVAASAWTSPKKISKLKPISRP